MIILKYNTLSPESLFRIERQYLRWVDDNSSVRSFASATELNVLDFSCTEDLYGFILGMFAKLRVFDTLNITTSQFLDFLIDVDKTYNDTPYHSFFHATDVVVVLYYILMDLKAKRYLTDLEIATLFVSTICHDAGHTGYNNDYHVKLKTELAIRYNNRSVLESLSVEISLDLIQKHGISMIDKTILRNLILSTDMTFHYDLLQEANALEDILSSVNLWDEDENDVVRETETLSINSQLDFIQYDDDEEEEEEDNRYTILDDKQRLSFMKILLHAADISNTVRVWPISKQWSDLIVQEFFRQGDAEKEAGFQVSPGMDRELATQASISLKFGDYVVKPYFEAVAGLLPSARIFLDVLEENREEWAKLKASPFATSITNYFNGFLQQRFSNVHSKPLSRRVNVPAGTVALPSPSNSSTNSVNKPMPILRTSSHSNLLISPQSSTSSELRRNSADHRNKQNTSQEYGNHHRYDQFKLYLDEDINSSTTTATDIPK
ncbi:unnamed protein product [Mucor hiemalis]